MRRLRLLLPLTGALILPGCFGGGKLPATLLTLSSEAPPSADLARSANAGQTITIDVPVTPKTLKSVRIPAQVGDTAVAYIKGAQWADLPERLFQQLLSETIKCTTNRVVLDPGQASLDVGLRITGQLDRFGFDTREGVVIVRYDAALAAPGGNRVESRRFEAREPSAGDPATVGASLNRAANRVAGDVAKWVASGR